MKLSSSRGFGVVVVLVFLAVATGAAWLISPKSFPGASRRADQSTKTTHELVAAKDAPAAANAASAIVIQKALVDVPESPATSFIKNEIPIMLARGPSPDPIELLAAERRRVAYMEGKLEEERTLTASALKDAAAMTARAAKAETAKAAADLALEQAAAAEHARTVQFMGASAIALLIALAYGYSKLYGVGPRELGMMAADIRQGGDPIVAMSTYTAPWLHKKIQFHAKQAVDLPNAHEHPVDTSKVVSFPTPA